MLVVGVTANGNYSKFATVSPLVLNQGKRRRKRKEKEKGERERRKEKGKRRADANANATDACKPMNNEP